MFFAHLPFYEQAILVLAALVLMLSFFMLAHPRILSVVHIYAAQSLLLTVATALVAYDLQSPHLYISAVLTLLLKTLFVPWLLIRIIEQFDLRFEHDDIHHPFMTVTSAGILVVFCYHTTIPIAAQLSSVTRNVIAICMAVVLLGMLMLISRRKAITQVAGFMTIENGLFFAAVSVTRGMPMIVELGIAFDVLVAAIIFGVFFLHIRESIDSLDTSLLSRLSEKDQR